MFLLAPSHRPATPPDLSRLGRFLVLAISAHVLMFAVFLAVQHSEARDAPSINGFQVALISFAPKADYSMLDSQANQLNDAQDMSGLNPETFSSPDLLAQAEPKSQVARELMLNDSSVLESAPEPAPVPAPPPEIAPEAEPKPEPVDVPKPQAVKPQATKSVAKSPTATKVAPPRESTPATLARTPVVFDAAYLKNPAPRYPASAFREKAEGTVVIRTEILANGQSARVELEISSGFDSLDDAALSTIKKWRFKPAMVDGKAISQWVTIPITFRLTKR